MFEEKRDDAETEANDPSYTLFLHTDAQARGCYTLLSRSPKYDGRPTMENVQASRALTRVLEEENR